MLRERGWGVEVMPTDPLALVPGTRELRGAHVSPKGELWLVGDQNLLARYDATLRRFVAEAGPADDKTNLRSVRVTVEGAVIVGAEDSKLYWRKPGEVWHTVSVDGVPRALWDDGAGVVYVASVKGVTRYDLGSAAGLLEQKGNFEAIHGQGGEVWAVGAGGQVWRRSGGSWARINDPNLGGVNLGTVYVPPSGGVWVAGDTGKLWHSDATRSTFNALDSGTSADLRSLHGSAEDDVWIGGADVLLHYPDMP